MAVDRDIKVRMFKGAYQKICWVTIGFMGFS